MSDENDPYYRDAKEQREAINTILDCTKDWPSHREHRVFKGLLAEVERLRDRLATLNWERDALTAANYALKEERDSARREVCESAWVRHPDDAACYARIRGWECFEEVQP